jgi:hypothetical protein
MVGSWVYLRRWPPPPRIVCLMLVLLSASFALGCNGYPVNDTTACRELRDYSNPTGVLDDFVANHGSEFAGSPQQAAVARTAALSPSSRWPVGPRLRPCSA